jgi:hypothetical protein
MKKFALLTVLFSLFALIMSAQTPNSPKPAAPKAPGSAQKVNKPSGGAHPAKGPRRTQKAMAKKTAVAPKPAQLIYRRED